MFIPEQTLLAYGKFIDCSEKGHYVDTKLFIPKLSSFDNVYFNVQSFNQNRLPVATKCSYKTSKWARKEHILINLVMQVLSSSYVA